MRFQEQNLIIYAISALILLVLFFVWAWKKRIKALENFADKDVLKELTASLDRSRQKIKIILTIIGISFLLIAVLRPQWGFKYEEVKRKGLDILIALDTSKSMLAEDVKPNRLERSKLAIRDLVSNLKGDRVGLVAFAGSSFLECPLTVDYGGFLLTLDSIDTNTIPREGTNITSAIKNAIKSFVNTEKKFRVLVIITDGEDMEGDSIKEAEIAKADGITIYTIGIGTKEGDLIPVIQSDGSMGFLKDRSGNVVKSRLGEETLQKIALATGGTYVRSSPTEFGLDLIYRDRLSKMEKRELESKMLKRYNEKFQIPLWIGLVILLIELLVGDRKKFSS